MQVNLRKVFKFDRSVSRLITELEIFNNLLNAIDETKLSDEDIKELLYITKKLLDLKEELNDKEAVLKIKQVIRNIANKIEEGESEKDKIDALIGDVRYLEYLDQKQKGNIKTIDLEDLIREIDEL